MAKAVIANHGAPLSISAHVDLVKEIKSEVALAHAKMVEAKGLVSKGILCFLRVYVHTIL